MNLPKTITFDMQPYGCVTLTDLRIVPNDRVATAVDLLGTVIAGVERGYLFGHVHVSPASGERRIYGVRPDEIEAGHVVRVAM